MDRALQERITGAIVLVVFIVLVVPVFLDGPAEDIEVVSESVSLPGQNGQESKRQTVVLQRDRTEPVPVTTPAETPEPRSPAPAAAREEPETDSPPTTATAPLPVPAAEPEDDDAAQEDTPAPAPTQSAAADQPPASAPPPATVQSSTGMWAVQLGSFSNKDNAERLASELRGKGYAAFLSQLSSGSGQLHRVRVGPQKDRDSAESIAAQLARGGHRGQVVPHP